MYDYMKGKLVAKNISNNPTITLEVCGIGYLISVNLRTIEAYKNLEEDDNVKVYVTLVHKEDAMLLCGFSTKEARDIFNILQSVSGIGTKVALVLLEAFDTYELISAVINENHSFLTKAKGVGPKLAKKIILELKDKLLNLQNNISCAEAVEFSSNLSSAELDEVRAVLASFGYSPQEIKLAFEHVGKFNYSKSEDILKGTLQFLASNS